MHIQFLGAASTVTGSKYLINTGDSRLLIDCGLYQGQKEWMQHNWEALPISPSSIDAVILTHAHIDHCGYLPVLVKNGFSGPIYATQATTDLSRILLLDSGHLQEADALRANQHNYSKHKPALPLYTVQDAEVALKQFRTVDFGKPYQCLPDVTAQWHRAGHILGASIVELHCNEQKIIFSGDLGRHDDPIMKPPVPIQTADYLIVESTYGDRTHADIDPKQQIADIINKTVKRGGTVLIPSFAVGRAQALLYYLYILKQENAIPNIPIYVDSPLSTKATEIMCHYSHEHKLGKQLWQDIYHLPTYIQSPEESMALNAQPMPKIIISASGMATGGRVLHHLKVYGPNHRNTIVFAGFQVAGTRGEQLVSGADEIKIYGEYIPIRATIENLANLSAHADYEEILQWLSHFSRPPKTTFITHGEPSASLALKQHIKTTLDWHCVIPNYLDKHEL